ncbi:BFD-like (2Fe-2S)-binding protein [Moraxella macacae 0408225]|uniref:Bacterioferritin-associated ferredoxin n=1 Tax=Moraxella macacae 0408225 TaxID=1230338 RepID=L2F712_9GAMM|nr:(2Fe-2S)-binding protein [Moraxella macacae]ELA08685.1 BFD-like (2Fe-2S)-binding protein [Moraxella macacae 0408225]
MFVCICNAVKEAQIKQAIIDGCDTLEALQNELDVATCCGGCQPIIEDYLSELGGNLVRFNPKLYKEVA